MPILIATGVVIFIRILAFINDPQGHARKEHIALMKIEERLVKEANSKIKRNNP